MPGAKINFIPCDFTTRTVDLSALSNQHEFLALGSVSSCHSVTDQLQEETLSQLSNTEITVVPIGIAGNLVWNALPINLALLAVPPFQTAVIVVPASLIQNAANLPVGDWLCDQAALLKVTDHLNDSENRIVDFPPLVPRNSAMPHWLQSRCASFALENVQSKPDAIAIKAGLFQIYPMKSASRVDTSVGR